MAPGVRASDKGAEPADPAPPPADLTTPADPRAKALAALRKQIEKNSDYVGLNFAAEARAMHEGDTPHRPIYGEANREDAVKLVEDGVAGGALAVYATGEDELARGRNHGAEEQRPIARPSLDPKRQPPVTASVGRIFHQKIRRPLRTARPVALGLSTGGVVLPNVRPNPGNASKQNPAIGN